MTIPTPGACSGTHARFSSTGPRRVQLGVIALASFAAAACAVALVSPADAVVLDQASWQVSNNQTDAPGATYTYGASVISAAIIGSVTIALPTAPTVLPTLGPIFGLGPGTLSTANNMIVYTLKRPRMVAAGTLLSRQFSGITNTTRQGWYSSILTTMSADATPVIVDAGETTAVAYLAQNNTPDYTAIRSLTLLSSGSALTITSPLQGYSVQVMNATQAMQPVQP